MIIRRRLYAFIKKSVCALMVVMVLFTLSGGYEVYAAKSAHPVDKNTVNNTLGEGGIAAPRAIKTVDTTIKDSMSQGGCWAQVVFKVSGTYAYNGSNLINTNMTVSIKSAPSDWTVAIDGVGYELSGTNLLVKIRYHYKASYYDCAFTGGYVYTMVEGVV